MKYKKCLYRLLICIYVSLFHTLTAHAKIILKTVDCIGNLTTFDYTSSSGSSISSINWKFGDGNTSTNVKANHIYNATGTYKVFVKANLANGNTELDSTTIQIVGLPEAKFKFQTTSDSCFYTNLICFQDQSLPAVSGQTLVKRILLWDDGNSKQTINPLNGEILCHKYSNTGSYKVTMEITDKYGCVNSTNYKIKVVGSVSANFISTVDFIDCNSQQVCVKNTSIEKAPSTVSYLLRLDSTANDKNFYLGKTNCITRYTAGVVNATMIARTTDGCVDSITKGIIIEFVPLPSKLILSDSIICYSSSKQIDVVGKVFAANEIQWAFDGRLVGKASRSGFSFTPKTYQLLPGKHVLKATISRGNCTKVLIANFEVKGPIASMGIVNQYQCSTLNQVSVYNTSLNYDTLNTSYFWKFSDPLGAKCTTDYVHDNNLYSNCNYAIGTYHKHVFSAFASNYRVRMIARDKLTGCVDSVDANIDMLRCTKLFEKSNYEICQGDYFYQGFQGGVNDPSLFTLDSTINWKRFPSIVNPPYLGNYNVGFIFKKSVFPWIENIGKDSIFIHTDTAKIVYDTLYKYNFLTVKLNKYDSLYFKDYRACHNNRVSVFFRDKVFYAGEKISVNWGDTTIDYFFNSTTYIDSLYHIYTQPLSNTNIFVNLYSTSGCYSTYSHGVGFDFKLNIKYIDPLCANQKICLDAMISDNVTNTIWQTLPKNTVLKWMFDSVYLGDNQLRVCHNFKTPGWHTVTVHLTNNAGCSDSLTHKIFIQSVKAGIANLPKVLFCTELRQFFDSSYALNPFDKINEYHWDFGNNTFIVTQQNPFISFNTSKDSVVIRLAVKTNLGCRDTTKAVIELKGGKPYFTIKDTIACGSLNAIFYNKSRFCSSYIWEFGDASNTSKDVNDTHYMRFNYVVPGKYKIKLIGIDTLYNPSTGNTYYCISRFPDSDSSRTVTVLPVSKSSIVAKDTICTGDSVLFNSTYTGTVNKETWRMGDGDTIIKTPPKPFYYNYTNEGQYRVALTPSPNNNNLCIDSAFKQITVLGVKADFQLNPQSLSPNFIFNNLSTPKSASLNWNFGHPASGALNTSTEQDPVHQYYQKKIQYIVCLKAKIPFGCIDSICKPFIDQDSASIILYNVFTPGNNDNKNDVYDILIEGENFYELLIYDRWGVLVYSSDKDYEAGDLNNWNGQYLNKGEDCAMGTYYYLFKYRIPAISKEIKLTNGVIQLIR